MPWNVQFRNGLHLPQIDWWLDAHFPTARCFVSHAHFDHLAAHREILCSEGTARLMRARLPGSRIEHVLPFNQTEALTTDASVTLLPAGHIFGSAQCLIDHLDHGSLLYTGDFKLRPGLSAERCATPRTDLLIMETTYGRPHYVFPPTSEVLAAIIRFCHEALDDGDTPVLFGYSLGKSQEVLSSLAGARLPAMLHPQTLKLTRVCEELGLAFPPHREFSTHELPGYVVICPPQSPGSPFLQKIPRPRTAMITGWALDPGATFRLRCDAAFPLSDHADFPDLLRFVDLVQPRRVLTLHGFAADFARTLRARGIDAWAINQDNQLEIPLPSAAATAPRLKIIPVPDPASPPPSLPVAADDFSRFAATAERIKTSSRKLEKLAVLSAYFATLTVDEDAAHAALFFTARPFPRSDPRSLDLPAPLLRRAIAEAAGASIADFQLAYRNQGDNGDAARILLLDRANPAPFSLAAAAAFFSAVSAERAPAGKLALLESALVRVDPSSASYLVKIISGDLRIGLKESLLGQAIADASARSAEAVRIATVICGDMSAVMLAARRDQLDSFIPRPFQPLHTALPPPSPAPVKSDTIRCQLHKQGPRVELYADDLTLISDRFPELVRAALALPVDVILDGEIVTTCEGHLLSPPEFETKPADREMGGFFGDDGITATFSTCDLFWRDGHSLLGEPPASRRVTLEAMFSISSLSPLHLSPGAPLRESSH